MRINYDSSLCLETHGDHREKKVSRLNDWKPFCLQTFTVPA